MLTLPVHLFVSFSNQATIYELNAECSFLEKQFGLKQSIQNILCLSSYQVVNLCQLRESTVAVCPFLFLIHFIQGHNTLFPHNYFYSHLQLSDKTLKRNHQFHHHFKSIFIYNLKKIHKKSNPKLHV